MNTIPLSCLPSRVTPNKVWFGCKAWGLSLKVLDNGGEVIDSEDGEEEEEEPNSEDEAFLLSELSELNRRVVEKNVWVAEKMVAQGGPKTSFTVGQFVTLAIPPKNRLSIEVCRLPCRVIKIVRNAYALLCSHGLLKGLH